MKERNYAITTKIDEYGGCRFADEALEDVKQTGRTALQETKEAGKEVADNAQQKLQQTEEKAKRESSKV